ncbi:hypothetical protein H4683_000748 [Filibacter limicola]|uniref:Uncharacterized protein n=1 Tax=Sporosarcina limicola TaxID=34101 RepID=A0A927MLD7_9BACL|nr:hypothetical protein [Sporosarcina limicola]
MNEIIFKSQSQKFGLKNTVRYDMMEENTVFKEQEKC